MGGFASQGEALQALQIALERLQRRNGRLAQITVSELADEMPLAEQLGPIYGPIILLRRSHGLAAGEWIALELRDLDRDARVVYVRGHRARTAEEHQDAPEHARAVPLQAVGLDTLERLSARSEAPQLFPAPHGGYLDLHNGFARHGVPRTSLLARP